MAPRQENETASLESRSYRGQIRRHLDRRDRLNENEEFQYEQKAKPYDKSYRQQYDRKGNSVNRTTFEYELKKDLAASRRVWQMISYGAARVLNRVLRQI